jgi:Sec7-like guanine-nucleotide exchange factor
MIGAYLGEPAAFNSRVCREFFNRFQFRNLSIDLCWRLVFLRTGLPKEGQQICRLIAEF